MRNALYLVGMAKVSILKKREHRKISFERRAYESVDDMSLPQVISQKSTEEKNSGTSVNENKK